ncbi:MAG: 30S ribosomal protein S5 [Planctomycetes bacterium]|nr:30S ribosomal protein S5 [Planctomycetota bacterium]
MEPRRGRDEQEGGAYQRKEFVRRGPPPGRSGRGPRGPRSSEEGDSRYEEKVVKINRCATVVKGGRRFSFSALVVVGDRNGQVGIGFGKANEVPPAVEKAVKAAKKNFFPVPVASGTIPHRVQGSYRSSMVVMLPAGDGTGVIAGATVRALMECAGVKNILTKVYGSTNPVNLTKAAVAALQQLKNRDEVMNLRGVTA